MRNNKFPGKVLRSKKLANGASRIEFDVNPTETLKLVAPENATQAVLDENHEEIISALISTVRPPVRRKGKR